MWTDKELKQWLETLGLAEYLPLFLHNSIGGVAIATGLDSVSLGAMGISNHAHIELLVQKSLELSSSSTL
jgi:hypothetical protein